MARLDGLWRGATVVIVGCGPSLTPEQVDWCRGRARVVMINDIDTRTGRPLAPWADWLHACDVRWWKRWPQAYDFAGIKTTCVKDAAVKDVSYLDPSGSRGFDERPGRVRTGFNGVYQAMHETIKATVSDSTIILLGVDMKDGADGKTHYHGGHAPWRPGKKDDPMYRKALSCFPTLIPELTKRRIRVVNCTPGSALECFPHDSPEKVLP